MLEASALGHWVQAQLAGNQFLAGGIVLAAIGAAIAYMRYLPLILWRSVERRFLQSIEVDATDPAFGWFRTWINQHPYSSKVGRLRLSSREERDFDPVHGEPSPAKPETFLTPGPGVHIFWHGGKLVWLDVTREKVKREGIMIGYQEELKIKVLGQDQAFLRDLVGEAYLAAHPPDDDRVFIFSPQHGMWEKVAERLPRPSESLVFEADLVGDIQRDVETFLARRAWYEHMGIPWRRGYLLHGPPGCGKTSIVLAIAGLLRSPIYTINLANTQVSDNRLIGLLGEVPSGGIVLIEEVDCLYRQRNDKGERESLMTSVSILGALDGVATPEGRILFLTTNHPETLDSALVRPGRVDLQVRVGLASGAQAERMFGRFFPDAPRQLAGEFGRALPENRVSMAQVQELLLAHPGDPSAAVVAASAARAGVPGAGAS